MMKWQYDSCIEAHPHWEHKFWTQAMADELLEQHYPWFLPVWRSYEREVTLCAHEDWQLGIARQLLQQKLQPTVDLQAYHLRTGARFGSIWLDAFNCKKMSSMLLSAAPK